MKRKVMKKDESLPFNGPPPSKMTKKQYEDWLESDDVAYFKMKLFAAIAVPRSKLKYRK